MSSLFRQLTAAAVAGVCATHPLLPDAFVLHMHDDHHVHAHAINLDAVTRHDGAPPSGHHEDEPPGITGESRDGVMITLAKDRWFAVHSRARSHVPSPLVTSQTVHAGSGWTAVGILPAGQLERSPPAPPPRARGSLHAVLLTSCALLI